MRRSADDSIARGVVCRESKGYKDRRENKNDYVQKADAGEVLQVNWESD